MKETKRFCCQGCNPPPDEECVLTVSVNAIEPDYCPYGCNDAMWQGVDE